MKRGRFALIKTTVQRYVVPRSRDFDGARYRIHGENTGGKRSQ